VTKSVADNSSGTAGSISMGWKLLSAGYVGNEPEQAGTRPRQLAGGRRSLCRPDTSAANLA